MACTGALSKAPPSTDAVASSFFFFLEGVVGAGGEARDPLVFWNPFLESLVTPKAPINPFLESLP